MQVLQMWEINRLLAHLLQELKPAFWILKKISMEKKFRWSFIEFIRPEMKFATLDDLKAQIAKDKSKAQRIV